MYSTINAEHVKMQPFTYTFSALLMNSQCNVIYRETHSQNRTKAEVHVYRNRENFYYELQHNIYICLQFLFDYYVHAMIFILFLVRKLQKHFLHMINIKIQSISLSYRVCEFEGFVLCV